MIEELTRWADDGGPCLLNDHDGTGGPFVDFDRNGSMRMTWFGLKVDPPRLEQTTLDSLSRPKPEPLFVPAWDGDYEDA